MNKKSAPVRLFEAINIMQQGVRSYSNKFTESNIKMGLYVISPKYAFVSFPTKEILNKIEIKAKDHFAAMDIQVVYCRYFTPPILPALSANKGMQATIDDYNITFTTSSFDKIWEKETTSRALIYCPSKTNMGEWKDWFSPQVSATRLTPLFYECLTENERIKEISTYLAQPMMPLFEKFIHGYVLDDDHIVELNRQNNWGLLYPEIKQFFNAPLSVYEAYLLAQQKIVQNRNTKVKSLLQAYIESIEAVVKKSELQECTKTQLLGLMRGNAVSCKGKYNAKRPAIILSDIECAQMLIVLIKEFSVSPKKHQILAEIALFIWMAQQCAFNDVVVKVEDILAIKVTEVNLLTHNVIVAEQEIPLTEGLINLLEAWMGPGDRVNQHRLLHGLTYDNLEKNIARYSRKLFGAEWQLQPRDFLRKVHVLSGARIIAEVGDQLEHQQELVDSSPYQLKMQKIKKHLLEFQS